MYSRYPLYKDSGVEWLGWVPAHWCPQQVKRLFDIVNGSTPKSDEAVYWNGDIVWVTPEDIGKAHGRRIGTSRRTITDVGYQSCGTTLVPPGSIVLTTRAPIGNVALAEVSLCTNQGCKSLVKRAEANSQYFLYFFSAITEMLQSLGRGSTFVELGNQDLGQFAFAAPPPDEQQEIAAFLDRETAQIEALIAKQERQIALLGEKRQALISHAVTKGLDPNAPMKDSGVEWLGEIPTHWTVYRNKTLFREVDDRSTTGEEELLTVSHITGVTPRSEKTNVTMFMAETLEGYKRCSIGDLIINTMWAWMGALGTTIYDGIVSPSYNVYRSRIEGVVEPQFYDLLCRTPAFITEIRRHSTGVWESRLRLYPG